MQDNGLTTAHTVAHEMAHLLGITHDPEVEDDGDGDGDDGDGPCSMAFPAFSGQFVMSARLVEDVGRLSWSPCSRFKLDRFLSFGGADCLLREEEEEKGLTPSRSPPAGPPPLGVVFDVDEQCRLRLGERRARACPDMELQPDDFCKILWSVLFLYTIYLYIQYILSASGCRALYYRSKLNRNHS